MRLETLARLIPFALWLAGCGTEYADPVLAGDAGVPDSQAGSGGQAGFGGSAQGGSAGSSAGAGGGAPGGAAGSPPSGCDAAAAALAEKTNAAGSCSTAVRIDYATSAILGYAIACGQNPLKDESAAREQAWDDCPSLAGSCGLPESSLCGATPADEFVFFTPASAHCPCCVVDSPSAGKVFAVSARTGLTLLGGAVNHGLGGIGIQYPALWAPPSDLGSNCSPEKVAQPVYRGFDLRQQQDDVAAKTLQADQIKPAMDVIWNTALPSGLAKTGSLFDAVALLYAPQVGSEANAEWIVMVNSGSME